MSNALPAVALPQCEGGTNDQRWLTATVTEPRTVIILPICFPAIAPMHRGGGGRGRGVVRLLTLVYYSYFSIPLRLYAAGFTELNL